MKLSEYAKNLGIHYNTAYKRFTEGKINGAYQLDTGTIIIPEHKPRYTIHISEDKMKILEDFFKEKGWLIQEYNLKTLLIE